VIGLGLGERFRVDIALSFELFIQLECGINYGSRQRAKLATRNTISLPETARRGLVSVPVRSRLLPVFHAVQQTGMMRRPGLTDIIKTRLSACCFGRSRIATHVVDSPARKTGLFIMQ
jgi:hypothetical protein